MDRTYSWYSNLTPELVHSQDQIEVVDLFHSKFFNVEEDLMVHVSGFHHRAMDGYQPIFKNCAMLQLLTFSRSMKLEPH